MSRRSICRRLFFWYASKLKITRREQNKSHRCGHCHAVDRRARQGRRWRLRLFPWRCLFCGRLNVGRLVAPWRTDR